MPPTWTRLWHTAQNSAAIWPAYRMVAWGRTIGTELARPVSNHVNEYDGSYPRAEIPLNHTLRFASALLVYHGRFLDLINESGRQ